MQNFYLFSPSKGILTTSRTLWFTNREVSMQLMVDRINREGLRQNLVATIVNSSQPLVPRALIRLQEQDIGVLFDLNNGPKWLNGIPFVNKRNQLMLHINWPIQPEGNHSQRQIEERENQGRIAANLLSGILGFPHTHTAVNTLSQHTSSPQIGILPLREV